MKRLLSTIGLVVALSGAAIAQDVRSLGLGGALVPGSSLAPFNPAYLNYPSDGRGGGLTLPVGLINFFVNPQMNVLDFLSNRSPYLTGNPPAKVFNFLAAFDQVTHLNSFILNTASAPSELSINLSKNGITLFDVGANKPLNLDFSSLGSFGTPSATSGVTPIFSVPFSIGPVAIKIGVFANVTPTSPRLDPAIVADVSDGNLDSIYNNAVTASAQAAAGITLDIGFSTPIQVDQTTVFVGARGNGFFGLAFVDASGRVIVKPGSTPSIGNAKIGYEYTVFLSSPFASNLGAGYSNGLGFGGSADVGVVADMPGSLLGVPELEKFTVGLGLIGVVEANTWTGTTATTTYDPDVGPNAITVITPNVTRGGIKFNPLITANAAGKFSVGGGLSVLALADIQLGRGNFNIHIGAEVQWTLFVVRAGVGLENGRFRFGLGGGLEFAPGIGMDLALTAHPTPFVGGTSFGIAVAVRFGF